MEKLWYQWLMRHKKPRAIVAILITKHSRYQFIFLLNFWAAFPLVLFQTLKNELGHIDACFNFKMITEAMIYTSSAEKTCQVTISVHYIVLKVSSLLPMECQQLPHALSRIGLISKEILTSKDSKKQEGPKKSQRALNSILLGYKCLQQMQTNKHLNLWIPYA